MKQHKDWFEQVADGRSLRSVASAIGTGHGNLSKWLNENKLSAEKVIDISYELDTDPVQALYDTGYLREVPAIERMTREELAERIYKLAAQLRKELEEETATVHQLHPRVQGVQQDWELVADSSPDEDETEDDWTDPNNIP